MKRRRFYPLWWVQRLYADSRFSHSSVVKLRFILQALL